MRLPRSGLELLYPLNEHILQRASNFYKQRSQQMATAMLGPDPPTCMRRGMHASAFNVRSWQTFAAISCAETTPRVSTNGDSLQVALGCRMGFDVVPERNAWRPFKKNRWSVSCPIRPLAAHLQDQDPRRPPRLRLRSTFVCARVGSAVVNACRPCLRC